MDEPISGQVAAIIDETTLVLNIGYREGVKVDMVFTVFSEGQEITDPQTGDALGKWEIVKADVVVTHVQERMATARSPVVEEAARPGTLSAQMVQDSFGSVVGRRHRLEVRGSDVSGRPKSQPVAVGDRVRLKLEATETGGA